MDNNLDFRLRDMVGSVEEDEGVNNLCKQLGAVENSLEFQARERERALQKDANRKLSADEIDEILMKERARKTFSTPGPLGGASTAALSKGANGADELMRLLDTEIGDPPLPTLESASHLGLVTLRPGPGLDLEHDSTSQVLAKIAERAPSAQAREFAKNLSARAAEWGQ